MEEEVYKCRVILRPGRLADLLGQTYDTKRRNVMPLLLRLLLLLREFFVTVHTTANSRCPAGWVKFRTSGVGHGEFVTANSQSKLAEDDAHDRLIVDDDDDVEAGHGD